MAHFRVEAGKIEGDGERNYKFIGEDHASLTDAYRDAQSCVGYHFIDMLYIDKDAGMRLMVDAYAVNANNERVS